MINKYNIEIMSPVHIGNGNKISPMEYILEDKFDRIDMDSLFEDKDFPKDEFIEKAKSYVYLGSFYPNIAKRHKLYSLEVCDELKKKKRVKEVFEFIKSGGKAYIPGSSLKGSIRTAILYYAIRNDVEIYSLVKNQLTQLSIMGGNKKKADDQVEEKFFGKTTYDFMKGCIVSDSNLASPDILKLELIKVLSVNIANKLQPKLELLAETLVGNKFEISIKIDDFYFKGEAKELGFSNKKEYLENLPNICNEYSKSLIEYEIDFFKKYGNEYKDLIEFYENLKNIENGFLLRISWGSGWHSMSVARLFQEEPFFMELRKKFRLGRKGIKIFPKSRKVVVDDKIYPLGWIKLEEIK